MIIDLETQFWNDPADLGAEAHERWGMTGSEPLSVLDASPEAHERAMSCVDLSVVLGFRSRMLRAHIPTERVAAFVAKSPRRRLGFAGIDPTDRSSAVAEIDAAVSLGLSGVVLAPAAQGFHPADSRAHVVYERCQELGLPILIRRSGQFCAEASMQYDRPLAFDEVARTFPRLKIVIGQFGFPWVDEMLMLAGKHANVYTDLAGIVSRPWSLYNALLRAFEYGVMDKLLFASNFPYDTPQRAIERLYSLNSFTHGTNLPPIPRQQLRNIIERDTCDVLGIARPEGASISRGIGLHPAEAGDDEAPVVTTLTDMLRTRSIPQHG